MKHLDGVGRDLTQSSVCNSRSGHDSELDARVPLTFAHLSSIVFPQVFGPIAFVSSLLGVTVIGYMVRRSGRASIIILLMVSWPPINSFCRAPPGSPLRKHALSASSACNVML